MLLLLLLLCAICMHGKHAFGHKMLMPSTFIVKIQCIYLCST